MWQFGVAMLVVFIRTPELFVFKFSHAPLITGSIFLPGLEYMVLLEHNRLYETAVLQL